MNELSNRTCPPTHQCPESCPCDSIIDIAESIAHTEDALACILNAECAKINKVLSTENDFDNLIAVNTSVQETIEVITTLEGVLKAKLDSIIPLLTECM